MAIHIENIKLLSILEAPSAAQGEILNRPSHAFVYKLSGQTVYNFEKQTVTLSQGQTLFIPANTSYTFYKTSPGNSRYLLINFQADIQQAAPEKYRGDFRHIFERAQNFYVLHTAADVYRATALLYELLAVLWENEQAGYANATRLNRLDPAVNYIRTAIFDPQLRIGAVHQLCGMSDVYFRKLFTARFGISPKKYVLTKRLSHAKALLDHGEYGSIHEIALLSGFEDPLYFSKVFRKTYGYAPSENRRRQTF